MILKIWDESGCWVYFDRIERISISRHKALEEDEPTQDYAGGTYTTLDESFNIATINRTWSRHIKGEPIKLAFLDGYLLGDDGQTIERL